jgi:hypothetical protein
MTALKLNRKQPGVARQTMFSLCIPKVDEPTTEQDIMACFAKLSLGRIHSVKVVQSFHGKKAFVNFVRWYSTPNALLAQERLNSNQNLNVVYRRPWFWRVKLSYRGGD